MNLTNWQLWPIITFERLELGQCVLARWLESQLLVQTAANVLVAYIIYRSMGGQKYANDQIWPPKKSKFSNRPCGGVRRRTTKALISFDSGWQWLAGCQILILLLLLLLTSASKMHKHCQVAMFVTITFLILISQPLGIATFKYKINSRQIVANQAQQWSHAMLT